MPRRALTAPFLTAAAASLALAACSAPAAPDGPGTAGGTPEGIVLGDAYPPDRFNPLDGHGRHGNSLLYDGLLQMRSAGDDAAPTTAPALAAADPEPSADGRTWTVRLRQGVTFSDGTAFDAADVVATYSRLLAPSSASSLASDYGMIATVEAVDAHTVRFRLRAPYAEFASRLLLGIAPSERLAGTVAESPLNTHPVGTGPYTLTQLTPDRAVFTAKPHHFLGTPAIPTVTVVHIGDDSARAQRMMAGELDGTLLPPALATRVARTDGLELVPVKSVDMRDLTLSRGTAFERDPAARLAMNLAVNRAAFVDTVLSGHGAPASTPIPPQVGAAYASNTSFPHDPRAAEQTLQAAGWVKGPDGIRAKGGERARFALMYYAPDTVRRDLSTAFAADMKKIGVEVTLQGLTWDKIEANLSRAALNSGGGRYATSVDSLVYGPLHHRHPTASSPYTNPGDYGSAEMDALLDRARTLTDDGARAAAYRQVQHLATTQPGPVPLVTLHHTYVVKKGAPRAGKPLILEPHDVGPTWGPWWNLKTWAR